MDNKLGEFLRKRRGDMSLREFASKCNISHTHLDSIEKGADPRKKKKVSVSTETLRLIADGIGVDYLYLACLADGVEPETVSNIRIPDDNSQKLLPVNLKLFDTPSEDKSGSLTMDGFTYAMHNESKDLPQEKKDMLLGMARFMKQEQETENGGQ